MSAAIFVASFAPAALRSTPCEAEAPAPEAAPAPLSTVVFVDGRRLQGKVVEVVPGSHVRLEIGAVSVRIPWDQIVRVEDASSSPTPMPPPRPPPEPNTPGPSGAAVTPSRSEPPADVGVQPTKSVWYGYQIMLTDAASAVFFVAAASTSGDRAALAWAGVSSYVLGGPIVHFAHGNVEKGFGDLGIRVLWPVLGFIYGSLFAFPCAFGGGSGCAGNSIGIGIFAVSAAIPPIADYTVIAFDRVPAGDRSRLAPPRLSFTPAVAAVQDTQRRVVPTLGLRVDSF